MGEYKHDKIFILISTPMVWSRTPYKEKKNENDGNDVEQVDEKGEAFARSPMELIYYNEGMNIIPTIHVQDLANIIQKIIGTLPEQNYIFAVDHGCNTQKQIIQSISDSLGTGLTRQSPFIESAYQENYDIMNLNIRLRATKIFEPGFKQRKISELAQIQYTTSSPDKKSLCETRQNFDFELRDEASFQESQDEIQLFEWNYKDGVVANIKQICEEFLFYRGLRSNRIMIAGPPASGKTHFGEMLANYYKLPYISIIDIVNKGKNRDDQLGQEIRQNLEQSKQKLVEEAQALFEAEQKKLMKKKGYIPQQFDDSKIIPRIPDEFLFKLFKQRLEQKDCKLKGYVLEGYPKTFDQAKGIFYDQIIPQKKSVQLSEAKSRQDTEQTNEPLLQANQETLPQKFIYLDGTDEFLKERVKKLSPSVIEGTHFNDEGMNRRLPLYRKFNPIEENEQHLVQFFRNESVAVQKVDLNEQNQQINALIEKEQDENQRENINLSNKIFNSLVEFVESDGKIKTYEEYFDQRDPDFEEKFKAQQEEYEMQKKQQEQKQKQKEDEIKQKQNQEKAEKKKMRQIMLKEKEILNIKSQALRQYLTDLVMPSLTEGFIQIANQLPNDPLNFLADFLIEKSNDL